MKVEKLTAAQCGAELEKVAGRLEEIKVRIAEIRPPRPAPPAPPGGTTQDWNPLTGAGAQFIAAHEAGDLDRLHQLREEFSRLGTESDHLNIRAEQLRQRQKAAQADEERREAPKVAQRAAKAFTPALERLEAALAELRAARDESEALLRSLGRARRLAGDDAPGLEPAQLAAWWRTRDGENLQVEEPDAGPGVLRSSYVQDVAGLVALPARAVRLVAEYLGDGRRADDDARRLVTHALVRQIAAGAADADSLARAALEKAQAQATSPERRAEVADSWLRSRSQDKLVGK